MLLCSKAGLKNTAEVSNSTVENRLIGRKKTNQNKDDVY